MKILKRALLCFVFLLGVNDGDALILMFCYVGDGDPFLETQFFLAVISKRRPEPRLVLDRNIRAL